jgi:type IV secretion system protein VirB8
MVSKVEKKDFAQYLAETKSWETDKVAAAEKSKKLAWIIAATAGGLTFLSVFALAMLSPLKTAVPYVIRVDKTTGAVDVVNALSDGKVTYDEAMNKYNVQWYVRYREGYSKDLIGEYYKNVGIMSAPDEQNKYGQWISPRNPDSPVNIYKNGMTANVVVKSTSFINNQTKNIASVRYLKEISDGANKHTSHWVATIVFQYVGTPMSEQDRAINPLGFQVLEYRNDPDQEVSEGRLLERDASQNFRQPTKPDTQPVPSIQ